MVAPVQSVPIESFLEVHGIRIHLLRRGEGYPLLALHGEDGASRWRAFHQQLAERFDVLLPDHPGFGFSDDPPWVEGIQDLVYHYLDLLDLLGLERVHLVGESFGGWLAAELAVASPERVARLVLIGPFGLKKRGLSLPDLFAVSREELAHLAAVRPETVSELAAPLPREALERHLRDRATLSRVGFNPYLHSPRLEHWLHRARMPTLLVWGRSDRLVPPDMADLWLQMLPKARLVLVDGAGHVPHLEEPESVARLVAEFLQEGG